MSAIRKVVEMIKAQQEKGLKKYGISVDNADLNIVQWIEHAQEELCDLLIYLQKAKETYKKETDSE
jgi:hypothetical protein